MFLTDNPDDPTQPKVKLLDWGIAKDISADVRHTIEGQLVGTPQYLAPEQARGAAVSPQTDVYSLGVMAYELFLEQLPFEAETSAEIMAMHLRAVPPPPSELWPDIPPGLESLLLAMLAKDPDARPTMLTVAHTFELIRSELRARRAEQTEQAVATIMPEPSRRDQPARGRRPGFAPTEPPAEEWQQPSRRWQYVVGAFAVAASAAMFLVSRSTETASRGAAEAGDRRDGRSRAPTTARPPTAEPAARASRSRARTPSPSPRVTPAASTELQRAIIPRRLRPPRRSPTAHAPHRRLARPRSSRAGISAPRSRRHPRPVPVRRALLIAATVARRWRSLSSARADNALRPEQIPAKARELAERGRTFHDAGDYSAAVSAFKEAYVLAPSPGLLFNIAQAYRLAGNCDESAWMYRRFLDTNPSGDRRTRSRRRTSAIVEKCGHGGLRIGIEPPRIDAKLPEPDGANLAVIATPEHKEPQLQARGPRRRDRRRRRADRRRRVRDRRERAVQHRRGDLSQGRQVGRREGRRRARAPRSQRSRPCSASAAALPLPAARSSTPSVITTSAPACRRDPDGARRCTGHDVMAVLRVGAILAIALAGASCYSPELRDCTVSCEAQSDCAHGQVCGADQFCAAPEIAGRCSSLPSDSGGDDRDAGAVDGKVDARPERAGPDLAMVPMHLKIDGDGRVTVSGQLTCEKQGSQNGDCMYQVPLGLAITLGAQPYNGQQFDALERCTCNAQGATCTFVPTGATDLHARFMKVD